MPAGDVESGRYDLGRLLGRGGLGEVYLAHDRVLGRDVAIKFVSTEKVADAAARRALLREARAAAGLDHPGICTVHEAGETADGRAFIVMQYVEGETLSAVLQHGALPVRDALTFCADIAEALGAAHRRGVIHRDLKPGNIMVTPGGRPKLVDFGIAKVILSRTESGDAPTATSTGTHSTGLLVGTPAYMSPEQVQHRPVDGRSDLFSLGLVLFECLTGRRAVPSSRPLEAFNEILHVHPPPPSSIRPELTEAHDELCRRLLAKDPGDRFQSAEEVVGAIRVLAPDTSRTPSGGTVGSSAHLRRTRRTAIAALVAAIVGLVGIGGAWLWLNRGGLPEVPEASDRWYQRGTEALREGAYHRARTNLQQAVKIFPQHALAFARLAEAEMELDDPQAAASRLVNVSQLVPNEARVPEMERLRLQAIRAMVLRQGENAVTLYREAVQRNPRDPGALVDLGRAQESAERRADARASYEQAIKVDSQYAPAYLRLGKLEGLESRREPALAAYREAERLYEKSSDIEGQAEVLLSRGNTLIAIGLLKEARSDVERALDLSTDGPWAHQQIRARLSLSNVTASEGRYAESERMTSVAVEEALSKGLDTVAADGLVDLAGTLIFQRQYDKAEESALRAIALADARGATRIGARAKAQLAEVYSRKNRPTQALDTLNGIVPFLKQNGFRRLELQSLLIATRARESLDQLEQARRDATDLLAITTDLREDTLTAVAASTLASIMTKLGSYSEALRQRERAEDILRRQGDTEALPFSLANRADLLILLGRADDAGKVLDEIDAGIAAGIDSYKGRRRRVAFLRALDAATRLRCREALPFLDTLQKDSAVDLSARLAPSLRAFCDARQGRRGASATFAEPPTSGADASTLRERHYWLAAAALQRRDFAKAAGEAAAGLKLLAGLANDELRWRLATVAAGANRGLGDNAGAQLMSATARDAYDRLRTAYQADFASYERRPDLAELRRLEQPR